MLSKLMKYELKATGRVFLPMYAALLILSTASRLLGTDANTASVIATSVSGIMIGAVCVMTLILTLQRFSKNLLGNEGYLMFTLPVGTDRLIISKLLISALWFVLSLLATLLSLMIMIGEFNWSSFFTGLSYFFSAYTWDATFFTIELLAIALMALFSGILLLYSCLAVGMLVGKRRGLFAFSAFVAFSIIGQIAASVLYNIGVKTNFLAFFENPSNSQYHLLFLLILALEAVPAAVLYFITRHMLNRKLNLE